MYMVRVHMSCSLHSLKSKETRGVKMFPTKTSRDVGMVGCVSEAMGSCMEKPTGGKSLRGTSVCAHPCACYIDVCPHACTVHNDCMFFIMPEP